MGSTLSAAFILGYHRFGRALYAIGGNAEAARAAGIPVDRYIWAVFVIAGGLAALSGLMLTGRMASVLSGQGQNMIFTVFAAAVIGRISLNGGKGSILGALCGVILLGIISNILTLSNIETFWISATYGAIILLSLILTRLTSGKSYRSRLIDAELRNVLRLRNGRTAFPLALRYRRIVNRFHDRTWLLRLVAEIDTATL